MSTLVVDTLTGKSTATTLTIGSTPVVSASANSLTIRGEGSNQTSIQQGLAKVFCTHNSSTAILNSHNISSLTDQATGITTHNYTNSFSAADNQSPLAMCVPGTDTLERPRGSTIAAGSMLIVNEEVEGSTTDRDADRLFFTSHGDLA